MRFGHFDDLHREYVIERPDTPLPWINYLGCQDYFALISNAAGGYSFYKDARLRRLTRFRYNNAPTDTGGRCLYIRDDGADAGSTQPRFWSPTWQPARIALDEYECRHGLGYTIIRSKLAGVASEIRYFVPLGENLEIWQQRITNERRHAVDLSVFAAVEFCLWDSWDDATNLQRNLSIGEVEVDERTIYHKSEYRERRNHFAFFSCSEMPAGFDTQREAFLGPYRGWEAPRAVECGRMSNSISVGWQPVGALQVKVPLEPGESRSVTFMLGYHENLANEKFDPPGSQTLNRRKVRPVIDRFRDPGAIEAAFQQLGEYWSGLLDRLQVRTPDPHVDRMVNTWNAYQVMATFNLSRSASYFESGVGRGIGFRDSNQDLLGFVHLVPERARARLLDIAATQLPSGAAYHQYQPLTKRGNNDIGSGFNDDPLWLVLSVAAYVKETGDWTILEEPVVYDNAPGTEEPLYSHLQRSIRFTLDRRGPHRLPLIGRADWNDCLNLNCFSEAPGQSFQTTTNKDGRTAESVFIAGLFILAAGEMAAMARKRRRHAEAEALDRAADEMEAAVWEAGWDGAWFRRAYDDFGRPVGSKECQEGQIFIEPQGVCVMAGLGLGDGRALKALDSVAERLATPHGILMQQPAYQTYQLHLGEISSYPPGFKENASIFCHNNPWVMIAEARAGRGERAFDYYCRINPSIREQISELHKCEPYVYAQMIAGRDTPLHGEAKNSWLTGTAAWCYVAITQWILGIHPTFDGLRLEPVLPPSWSGFDAVREFRGVRYDIHVERRGKGNAVELEVDGKPVGGTVVPLPGTGVRQVRVTVRLG